MNFCFFVVAGIRTRGENPHDPACYHEPSNTRLEGCKNPT